MHVLFSLQQLQLTRHWSYHSGYIGERRTWLSIMDLGGIPP